MHEHQENDALEIDSYTQDLLGQIMIPDDAPLHAHLGDSQMKTARATLRDRIDDKLVFFGLCVVAARLAEGGLQRATEQFLELAQIGLRQEQVAQTFEQELSVRRAATMLQAGLDGAATTQQGVAQGANVGIGLRGGQQGAVGVSPALQALAKHAPQLVAAVTRLPSEQKQTIEAYLQGLLKQGSDKLVALERGFEKTAENKRDALLQAMVRRGGAQKASE